MLVRVLPLHGRVRVCYFFFLGLARPGQCDGGGNDQCFDVTELCSLMVTNTGMSVYSSTAPESTYTDLHMGMTFTDDLDLAAGETLVVWVELFTTPIGSDVPAVNAIISKSRANFCEDFLPGDVVPDPNVCGCCVTRGDAKHDNGIILVDDIVYLVDHLFKGGPPPPPC